MGFIKYYFDYTYFGHDYEAGFKDEEVNQLNQLNFGAFCIGCRDFYSKY